MAVFVFSVAIEVMQFIFAIGTTARPTDQLPSWWSTAHEHTRRCWWNQERGRWMCPRTPSQQKQFVRARWICTRLQDFSAAELPTQAENPAGPP